MIAIYSKGWLLVLATILVGATIHFDLIARAWVFGAALLSLLPVPGIHGRFGPDGDSLAWHNAREFVRNQGKAMPIWMDAGGVERTANVVLKRLDEAAGDVRDRAATPEHLTVAECGNLALIGCIIEQTETDLRAPERHWDIFYAALARVPGLFAPEAVRATDLSASYSERVRDVVNPFLEEAGQPQIDGAVVDQDVDRTVTLLAERFAGDARRMASRWGGLASGSVETLFANAKRFPRLGSDDGMRPQFVKLCIRWGVIAGVRPRIFDQPFSARLAWLLLHEGAINPLLEQKTVTFKGPVDRPASRIAAKAVADLVLHRLDTGKSSEMSALRDLYHGVDAGRRTWSIRQEADTTMWRIARELVEDGRAAQWRGEPWRWKFEGGLATRV
jgi:hypothetical protein